MSSEKTIVLPSRQLDPELVKLLKGLQPGEKIKIIQTVRVGGRKWTTESVGTFRGLSYLSTGVTTERVPEDDIIVPTVHFVKEPNNELTSISLDENTKIVKV